MKISTILGIAGAKYSIDHDLKHLKSSPSEVASAQALYFPVNLFSKKIYFYRFFSIQTNVKFWHQLWPHPFPGTMIWTKRINTTWGCICFLPIYSFSCLLVYKKIFFLNVLALNFQLWPGPIIPRNFISSILENASIQVSVVLAEFNVNTSKSFPGWRQWPLIEQIWKYFIKGIDQMAQKKKMTMQNVYANNNNVDKRKRTICFFILLSRNIK